jgi:pilus assembly protein CpaE
MAERTTVLVVEVFPKIAETVTGLLKKIESIELAPGTATNSESALQIIRQTRPDIVLLELELPGQNGIQVTEIIKRELPQTQVIILSEVSSAETVRQAMRAGAIDFINYNNLTFEELLSVIQHVSSTVQQEKIRSRIQPQAVQAAESQKTSTEGKIISVFSPKGGAGVSTIVTNLAVAIKDAKPDATVLLVDLDLQFGDICLLFNLFPTRSIIDLAVRVQNIDEELIESVVYDDKTYKLSFLAPPEKPDLTSEIDPAAVTSIFSYLRKMYDYVLVNVDSHLAEGGLMALSNSDQILLVAIQQVAAIRSLRSFINLLADYAIPKDKIAIILNRYDETNTISAKKIGEMLSIGVAHVIPFDMKTTERSANLGVPFTFDNKKQEISRSFTAMLPLINNRQPAREKQA